MKRHSTKIKDMTGQRFGHLVVLAYSDAGKHGAHWLCRCDCGKEKIINGSTLRNGMAISCRCFKKAIKHGGATNGLSREYRAWDGMKQRCYNPNHESYPNYGARGIVVCDRWRNSFAAFFEDMGRCPPGKSLDRKENNGNYEPGNCQWSTKKEQDNNKRNNRRLDLNGRTQTMTQWATEYGIPAQALKHRLDRGWPLGVALSSPLQRGHRPAFSV